LKLHLNTKTHLNMKKLFLSLAVALGISAASFAQTAAPVAVKTAPPVAAKQTAPKKIKATPTAKPAPASPAIAKVKADGTPDMRYKENKQAKTAAPGPKKADGTPDMRYKKNKVAAAPKTTK
jgi:hypothetical protein